MPTLAMGTDTYRRRNANVPDISYINRFYESNPTDQVNQSASIRRPGLANRLQVGTGPIRTTYWQSGFANDALFIVSKNELFRLENTPTGGDSLYNITGNVFGTGTPDMVARKDYLFITDGITLQWTDGSSDLAKIDTPDDVVITSLDVLKGYVFLTVSDTDRFYWIEPGENTIDPLNFATAESQPDILLQCRSIGDQIWMFGRKSTEPWYLSGDADAPVMPAQGRPYSRGIWGGTAVQIGDEVIVLGDDGKVYSVTGGAEPISYPGIEERISNAMKIQQLDL